MGSPLYFAARLEGTFDTPEEAFAQAGLPHELITGPAQRAASAGDAAVVTQLNEDVALVVRRQGARYSLWRGLSGPDFIGEREDVQTVIDLAVATGIVGEWEIFEYRPSP